MWTYKWLDKINYQSLLLVSNVTELENKELIEAKWKSLLRHILNIHSGHGDLYPECSHSPLTAKDQKEITWLTPGTQAFDSLEKIVANSIQINSTLVWHVINSSAYGQTSTVEGYHSLVNQFAPKIYHERFIIFHSLEWKADYSWQPCITMKMLAEIKKETNMEHWSLLFSFQNLKRWLHY